jgi:DMSO/TMAO reductase YedYZ molybdopterin-dependent catalytic subunit
VQAHAADVVCEEGWRVPAQRWAGVAIAAVLARAGVQPAARFLKGHAGDLTVLPLEEALTGGALLRLVAPGRAGAPSAG